MKTKDKIHLLLKTAGIATPREMTVTTSEITLEYGGDTTGLVGALVGILQENDVNYPDPRANTYVAECAVVERDTDTTVKTTIKLPVINKTAYDKILASAEDTDGDGKQELKLAQDTDKDGRADDTNAKIKK